MSLLSLVASLLFGKSHRDIPSAGAFLREVLDDWTLVEVDVVPEHKWLPSVNTKIDSRSRSELWRESSSSVKRTPTYDECLKGIGNLPEGTVREINTDLDRSGPGITFSGKSDMLERVLKAYAIRNPVVGYVQGLNMIAAEFLVVGMSEEDAFLGLSFLVENVAHDYYLPGFPGFFNDMEILTRLLAVRYPRESDILSRFDDVMMPMLNDQNCLTLFTVSLPPSALLRVWDVVMVYGRQALIAAELAVLGVILKDCFKDESTIDFENFPMYASQFKRAVSLFPKERVDELMQEISETLVLDDIQSVHRFS